MQVMPHEKTLNLSGNGEELQIYAIIIVFFQLQLQSPTGYTQTTCGFALVTPRFTERLENDLPLHLRQGEAALHLSCETCIHRRAQAILIQALYAERQFIFRDVLPPE